MKFFDLKDYYTTNFSMINSGKWNLQELNEMMFWEREIYVNLIAAYNEEQKNLAREREMRSNYGR
jgi:hypothetical protein